MRAILIGATGATGTDLLSLLTVDDSVSEVSVFSRRELPISDPKLRVHVVDFDDVASWSALVQGDVLFCCLGTTLKQAGSPKNQWKVDHDYQLNFARCAKENGVTACVLVSADKVSERSPIFYSRMKAHLEKEIEKLGFETFHVFRPPLLIRKNSDRVGEKIAEKVLCFFNFLGLFRDSKPLKTEDLAKAMLISAKKSQKGNFLHLPKDIVAVLG